MQKLVRLVERSILAFVFSSRGHNSGPPNVYFFFFPPFDSHKGRTFCLQLAFGHQYFFLSSASHFTHLHYLPSSERTRVMNPNVINIIVVSSQIRRV